MDKQELKNVLRLQAESFEDDVKRKIDYLNSDDVFSEYTSGLGIAADDDYDDEGDDDEDEDDEDEDDEDDEDDDDEDEDEDEDDDDDDDDDDDEVPSVDPETLKKQKLAAKIAAMRGLSAPNFLKK